MSVLDVKYNQEMSNFVLSVIMEQKHYDYEKDDYVDIGISTFKDWLKDTKNLVGKFPFGYLKKKYGDEFTDFLYQGHEGDKPSYYTGRHTDPEQWGRTIVKYGIVSDLPTLAKEGSFMETYSRFLPRIIEMLKLPNWLKIEFVESQPYQVYMNYRVDFPEMIKSTTNERFTTSSLFMNLKKHLEKYLGVDFGKIVEGKVSMKQGSVFFNGFDEWVKNVFNKELKKEFKNLPNGNDIHSISLKHPSDLQRVDIKITTRRNSYGYRVVNQIRDLMNSKGYNPNYLEIVG